MERIRFILSDAFTRHSDVVGDDKRRIESDAKLSDKGRGLLGVFGFF